MRRLQLRSITNMGYRRFLVWGSALCLFLAASVAGAQAPSAPAAGQKDKLVLCWYMVCFSNSVERYKQEIELAQRHGIDGFLLDVGSWNQNKGYVTSSERLYEAAKQLGTGFKLAMAPEYSVQPFPDEICDMAKKFKDHPNQLRHNGKVVLSGYCSADMFAPALEKLKAEGLAVVLVTHVFLPRFI